MRQKFFFYTCSEDDHIHETKEVFNEFYDANKNIRKWLMT